MEAQRSSQARLPRGKSSYACMSVQRSESFLRLPRTFFYRSRGHHNGKSSHCVLIRYHTVLSYLTLQTGQGALNAPLSVASYSSPASLVVPFGHLLACLRDTSLDGCHLDVISFISGCHVPNNSHLVT